jgi:hypothetical protein
MAYLPSLAALLLVLLHLIFEGYRWQMVPAYALTALLFLATLRDILPRGEVPTRPGPPAWGVGDRGENWPSTLSVPSF